MADFIILSYMLLSAAPWLRNNGENKYAEPLSLQQVLQLIISNSNRTANCSSSRCSRCCSEALLVRGGCRSRSRSLKVGLLFTGGELYKFCVLPVCCIQFFMSEAASTKRVLLVLS